MRFTDRFIKIPIKVYNKAQADLVNKIEYEDSWMKISPFEISEYKPTQDEENENYDCVYLVMKSGSGVFVYMSINEFEALLNERFSETE